MPIYEQLHLFQEIYYRIQNILSNITKFSLKVLIFFIGMNLYNYSNNLLFMSIVLLNKIMKIFEQSVDKQTLVTDSDSLLSLFFWLHPNKWSASLIPLIPRIITIFFCFHLTCYFCSKFSIIHVIRISIKYKCSISCHYIYNFPNIKILTKPECRTFPFVCNIQILSGPISHQIDMIRYKVDYL